MAKNKQARLHGSETVFPLAYMKTMERKYPRVLSSASLSILDLSAAGVHADDANIMLSLYRWKADKVYYNFESQIAEDLILNTDSPDKTIPVSFLKLPYPCIAVSLVGFDMLDPQSQRQINSFTGNAFIWEENGTIIFTWEMRHGGFTWGTLPKDKMLSINDAYEEMIKSQLSNEGYNDHALILKLLRVNCFSDITSFDTKQYNRLRIKYEEEGASRIITCIRLASTYELLLHRVIQVLLYLNCSNADIETAEEKLKAGAWASPLGGNPATHIPKTKKEQVLRQLHGINAQDVGYRIAGKFKRSYSEDDSEQRNNGNNGTGTGTRGYSKRRAHYHHFWVGPKNAPIAEDIMHPQSGERGLVLYWLEATEVHPELKDDIATVVEVE